jgi:hypothetical protein
MLQYSFFPTLSNVLSTSFSMFWALQTNKAHQTKSPMEENLFLSSLP